MVLNILVFFDKYDYHGSKDIFWEITASRWKIDMTRMLKFDGRSGVGYSLRAAGFLLTPRGRGSVDVKRF